MICNTFHVSTGELLIAQEVGTGKFTYLSLIELERNPELYIPYDFTMQKRPPVIENGTKYERWARIPTRPTKQKEEPE